MLDCPMMYKRLIQQIIIPHSFHKTQHSFRCKNKQKANYLSKPRTQLHSAYKNKLLLKQLYWYTEFSRNKTTIYTEGRLYFVLVGLWPRAAHHLKRWHLHWQPCLRHLRGWYHTPASASLCSCQAHTDPTYTRKLSFHKPSM